MNEQIQEYLQKNNVVTKNQYGFIKNKGTIDAIIKVADFIKQNIDNKRYVGAFTIDLKKAFDSINYKYLIEKLQFYGFSDDASRLMESYLVNRKDYYEINNEYSDYIIKHKGVPQGSALSAILFNIYVNDIINAVKTNKDSVIYLYADDIIILSSSKNIDIIIGKLSEMFSNISEWCKENDVMINYKKCNFIIFSSDYKKNTLI